MKYKFLLIMVITAVFCLTGCFKRDSFQDIDIYTSVYPIEYIASRLYGTNSNIHSIYPDGVNIDDYKLTEKQIKDYSKARLFIFNGLGEESDYVVQMINHNKNMKIIDATLSMEFANSMEELWLDPSNFLKLAQNIRVGFKEYINNHYLKNEIDEQYEKLKLEISELDAKLNLMTESTDHKTIVVGSDVFKFLEKYNFTVISLEENENLTDKVLADVKDLIAKKEIDYIFMKQNEEANATIKKLEEDTKVELVTLHLLSNITESERSGKKDYIALMNENMDLIKNEIYD